LDSVVGRCLSTHNIVKCLALRQRRVPPPRTKACKRVTLSETPLRPTPKAFIPCFPAISGNPTKGAPAVVDEAKVPGFKRCPHKCIGQVSNETRRLCSPAPVADGLSSLTNLTPSCASTSRSQCTCGEALLCGALVGYLGGPAALRALRARRCPQMGRAGGRRLLDCSIIWSSSACSTTSRWSFNSEWLCRPPVMGRAVQEGWAAHDSGAETMLLSVILTY
jgi:hypothetical protein